MLLLFPLSLLRPLSSASPRFQPHAAMTGLAILQREIGSVSRKGTSYLLRAVFVFLLAMIVTLVWASEMRWSGQMSYSRMSAVGRGLFAGLFVTEVVLVSLVGPLVTGGLIAQERERRTLDLLFMTPMRDYEIVFGKFLSRMAYILGLILLSTPVLLGCLIFGGVSPEEILLGAILVFVCALWSGAIGMFLSAFTRKGYLAVVGAYFVLLVQCFGLPMIFALTFMRRGRPGPAFFLTSPQLYSFARILSEGQVSFWGIDIWGYVAGGTTLLSLLLVLVSVRFLRRTPPGATVSAGADTKVRKRMKPARNLLGSLARIVGGVALVATLIAMVVALPLAWEETEGLVLLPVLGAATVLVRVFFARRRRSAGQQRVWENPVAWREIVSQRSPGVDRMVNLVLFAMAGFMFLFIAFEGGLTDDRKFHGAYLGAELCATLVVAIVLAAASIGQEAEAGRLDLLLGTPLHPAKVLIGKMLGVFATLAPLLVFMMLHAGASGMVCGRIEPEGVGLAVGIIVAQTFFHASLALLFGFWFRRTGMAIGMGLGAGLFVFLFLPILAAIMSFSDTRFPFVGLLYSNPAVSVFLALAETRSYRGDYATEKAAGCAIAMLLYFVAGLALQAFMASRFNRFVQRRG